MEQKLILSPEDIAKKNCWLDIDKALRQHGMTFHPTMTVSLNGTSFAIDVVPVNQAKAPMKMKEVKNG